MPSRAQKPEKGKEEKGGGEGGNPFSLLVNWVMFDRHTSSIFTDRT